MIVFIARAMPINGAIRLDLRFKYHQLQLIHNPEFQP
jgi:hypothetical protein